MVEEYDPNSIEDEGASSGHQFDERGGQTGWHHCRASSGNATAPRRDQSAQG